MKCLSKVDYLFHITRRTIHLIAERDAINAKIGIFKQAAKHWQYIKKLEA